MNNKIIIYKVEKSYGTFYKETVITPTGAKVEIGHHRHCTPEKCFDICPSSDLRDKLKYLIQEMVPTK